MDKKKDEGLFLVIFCVDFCLEPLGTQPFIIYKWLAINWMMISNLYIGNGWKSPILCLRFQVVHPFISGDFAMMANITERINIDFW